MKGERESLPLQIAIDGPAGAGKTTVAMRIAQELGIPYLDTGGMYRAVALHCLRQGIDPADESAVIRAAGGESPLPLEVLPTIPMRFRLSGEDVTDLLRTPEVSMAASTVSRYRAVRERLVAMQQAFARAHPVVAEGRDIGTVVLPDAPVKIYLTASLGERARRRLIQMRGPDAAHDLEAYRAVAAELARRDWQDSTRAESPLRIATGALVIDTTCLTVNQVVALVLERVRRIQGQVGRTAASRT